MVILIVNNITCSYQESYRENQWDVRNIFSIQKLFVKLELELLWDSEDNSAQWRQPEIFKRAVHEWEGRDPEYIRQFIRKRIKVSNWETNLGGVVHKWLGCIVHVNTLFLNLLSRKHAIWTSQHLRTSPKIFHLLWGKLQVFPFDPIQSVN